MSHLTAEGEAFAVHQETRGDTAGVVTQVLVLPALTLDPEIAGQVGLELWPVRHRAVPQFCVGVEVWQRCVLEKKTVKG